MNRTVDVADSTIEVSGIAVHERLRQARQARGEDLRSVATRLGVRHEHLAAIEDGRFRDLPPGIYGRAAIRSFADWCGFDPPEVLAACEPLLAPMADPIAGLATARGLKVPARSTSFNRYARLPIAQCWRLPIAAACDAFIVAGCLLAVIVCTVTTLWVPPSALARSATPFGLVGVLGAAAYFLCFGGVGGRTPGERLLGLAPCAPERSPVTLQQAVRRAFRSAMRDASFILRLGTVVTASTRTAQRSLPVPSQLQPRGPSEAPS